MQTVETRNVLPLVMVCDEIGAGKVVWDDVANSIDSNSKNASYEKQSGEMVKHHWEPLHLPKRKAGEFYIVDQ